MKRKSGLSILMTAVLSLLLFVVSAENPTKKNKMPKHIKTIVDKSCYGCHNSDSKNEDGKEALDFKKFDQLSLIKKVSAYKKIGDVVTENEMPPKKFLARYPDKALTDEEKKSLIEWSKKEAEALVKSK